MSTLDWHYQNCTRRRATTMRPLPLSLTPPFPSVRACTRLALDARRDATNAHNSLSMRSTTSTI
jgi:hypothetical protein